MMFLMTPEMFCNDKRVNCGNCAAFFAGDTGQPDGAPEKNPMIEQSGRGACKRNAPQTSIHIIRQTNAVGQQQNTVLNTPAFPLVHPDNKCMEFIPRSTKNTGNGVEIVDVRAAK